MEQEIYDEGREVSITRPSDQMQAAQETIKEVFSNLGNLGMKNFPEIIVEGVAEEVVRHLINGEVDD